MAENSSSSPSPSPPRQTPPSPPPQYVEVNCRSSGKTRRFAAGSEAGFAVALINRKVKGAAVAASHIEAVKDGEEPIAFGPTSLLLNFGDGWNLQTVTLTDHFSPEEVRNEHVQGTTIQTPGLVSGVLGPQKRVSKPISFLYIVKIVFAFILVFVLGAIFTLFLDNLPAFILLVKSIM